MSTLSMFEDREVLSTKTSPLQDSTGVPHSLEEKLAIRSGLGDNVARRTRKSIMENPGSRPVGWRGSRRLLMLDTGLSRSFWVCASESKQELLGALYEKVEPTEQELAEWSQGGES